MLPDAEECRPLAHLLLKSGLFSLYWQQLQMLDVAFGQEQVDFWPAYRALRKAFLHICGLPTIFNCSMAPEKCYSIAHEHIFMPMIPCQMQIDDQADVTAANGQVKDEAVDMDEDLQPDVKPDPEGEALS